jgi:hypothetical protein
MELREWATQRFGTSNGRRLIEPTVYPERELQEDLITLDRSHREIESRIDELNDELESIYEEGAQAPEFKRQALAERAGVIENSLDQQKAAYRAKSKKLGLLRAIKGVRERMGSEDLHVNRYMEEADSAEIQATIKSELTDLRLESEDVNEIMTTLNISASRTTASASSNTDKHIERMEQRAESRHYSASSSHSHSRSD